MLRQIRHLHSVEEEFVPDAVLPDDALLHLGVLPLHGEVQQPFFERRRGSALDLVVKSKQSLSRLTLGSFFILDRAVSSAGDRPCHTRG